MSKKIVTKNKKKIDAIKRIIDQNKKLIAISISGILLIILILVAFFSNRNPIHTDIYQSSEIEIDDSIEELDESNTDEVTNLEIEVDETDTTPDVNEDIYGQGMDVVESGEVESLIGQGGEAAKQELEKQIANVIDKLYFNFYFQPDETGIISERDRIRFAISYIYQYEYQELKIDTTNFEVYIPLEHVNEIVLKFFDTKVTAHENIELPFNGEDYVVPMKDSIWDNGVEIKIIDIFTEDSLEYLVEFHVVKDEIVKSRFKMKFVKSHSIYVPTEYIKIEEEQ